MPSVIDFASLLIAALAIACIGWAVVVLTSRLERQRQERHTDLGASGKS